jgi:hypothetical protein
MSVPAGIENVNICFQLKLLFQVPLFEALEMRGCRFPSVLQSDNGIRLEVPPMITILVLLLVCLGKMYATI